MTRDDFERGMTALAAAFPDREELPEVKAARGRIYRATLIDLEPKAWQHAVTEAVRREEFFPTVAKLRQYAAAAVSSAPALPAPRSPEQIEASRDDARANLRGGLDIVRRELAARGVAVDAEPVRSMPASSGEEV